MVLLSGLLLLEFRLLPLLLARRGVVLAPLRRSCTHAKCATTHQGNECSSCMYRRADYRGAGSKGHQQSNEHTERNRLHTEPLAGAGLCRLCSHTLPFPAHQIGVGRDLPANGLRQARAAMAAACMRRRHVVVLVYATCLTHTAHNV